MVASYLRLIGIWVTALVAGVLITDSAWAALTIDSATLNGGASVTVGPNATITLVVNETNTAGSNWRATAWRISTTPPGTTTCINHANHNTDNSFTETFTITAPAAAGTYNAYVIGFANNNCLGGEISATFPLTNGVIVDATPPTVSSITRLDADPNNGASVRWTVTFSESVSGVDAADFALVQGGAVSGAAITSVTGSGNTWTVTASTGTGDGTLGLNLVDNDTIIDVAGNRLGGTGVGNGNFTGQVYTIIRVASFNVVETGASATAGLIFTKIAGQDIAVDIVALNASNTLATAFTGTVAVELVDNSGGGACASLPLIKTLTSQTFTAGNAGRHPLSAGQFEANAWRNVKFRIKYPTASPTVTSCSSDAFANRPLQLVSLLVRDQDRTSAGTTRTLNNTSNPGTGFVHNAGRPFRIDATAQNGAGVPATTTNYTPDAVPTSQPVAILTPCGGGSPPAACVATPGTLSLGTWSGSGVITTTTATYNDVGAFDLVLQDRSFTSVDSSDPGYPVPATHYISSAPVTVGRFVPDYFTLEVGSTITPRSDIAACSASTFTYMDERMNLAFTLKAREFSGGAVTPNYSGATLGALVLNSSASYSFGAIDSTAPTPLTSRLDLSLISGATGSWSAGSASVATSLALSRAATPDGPYASLKIGIAPSDPDGVTLQAAALNLDADNSGSAERAQVGAPVATRFGRLRLQNAVGSEKIDLPIPLEAQYWNGTGFVTNTADSCTSLTAANLSLGAYTGGINATNMGVTHISLGGAFSSGVGSLTLTKPSPVSTSPGTTTLTVDLSAEAKSYLKGNWGVPTYTANPSSRAAFGLYGTQPKNFIYFRENY